GAVRRDVGCTTWTTRCDRDSGKPDHDLYRLCGAADSGGRLSCNHRRAPFVSIPASPCARKLVLAPALAVVSALVLALDRGAVPPRVPVCRRRRYRGRAAESADVARERPCCRSCRGRAMGTDLGRGRTRAGAVRSSDTSFGGGAGPRLCNRCKATNAAPLCAGIGFRSAPGERCGFRIPGILAGFFLAF